jgi:hypothetical protein
VLVGLRVTLKYRIRRRSWAMTKKQYSTPNVKVGTVKKSIAAMASRWLCRKVSQRFAGSGFFGACCTQRETVRSDIALANQASPGACSDSRTTNHFPLDIRSHEVQSGRPLCLFSLLHGL